MTPPWSELFLILQKLPKDSQTGIGFRTAVTGTVVQIFAAAEAQALAVWLAQQLGIHV